MWHIKIKASKAETDRYEVISLTRGIFKKDTNEPIYKTVIDSEM